MSLVQWNCIGGPQSLDRPMEHFLNQLFTVQGDVDLHGRDWTPAVDVYETDDHELVVSAELPGVDRKDVEVTLEEGLLTIAGERKIELTGEGRWYRTERSFGTFRRSFTLPRTVDIAAARAEHKDGTLNVKLPIKDEAKPQRISVKAAE
ncbi:MAG: Hsp20/alpha crystallin family protein [Acidobacteriota bacterium]|nr:Hsp20/alpha crystallin family protein [Acidobacteriota bacterium]